MAGSIEPRHRGEDLLREVARRVFVAGCGCIEFHEEDCQAGVQAILDDVSVRKPVLEGYDDDSIRIATAGIPMKTYPPVEIAANDDDRIMPQGGAYISGAYIKSVAEDA